MIWLLVSWGCGGSAQDGPTFHADVQPMLTEQCRGCHTQGGSGPFALDSYDDAAAWAEASLLAMDEGRMPPWLPDPECRSYFRERLLPDGALDTFRAWVDAGMPEGDPVDTPAEPDPPTSFAPTHVLTGTDGYVAQTDGSDDYRCFILDGDFPTDAYLRGSQVTPGTRQVHHVLVYALTADQVPGVQAVDAAEEGPGYTCFGGPYGDDNPDQDDSDLPIQIASWVPGNVPALYPDDLSVRIPAGSRVVMQVHYSTVAGDPEPDDTTSVDLWLQDEPTPFLSTSLPLPILSLDIPAGATDATFTQRFTNYDDEPIEVRAMAGHMHLLGTKISAWLRRPDGDDECGLDIPAWDFGWQQSYVFLDPMMVQPGESIEVSCTYDNSEANQAVVDGELVAPRDVAWGDGTLDEMCIVYIATREPWFPTPVPEAAECEGLASCGDCDGQTDCALSCDAVGGDCGLCVLEQFGECSVDTCGLAWLPILDCLEDCVVNAVVFSGTVGECFRDRCSDSEYESLVTCLEGTLEPGGPCEGALDVCGG